MLKESEVKFVEEQEEEVAEEEPKPFKILTEPKDPTIEVLYNQFKEGDLNIQPEYQRYSVWDDQKKRKLIESVLLNIPLPVIYLADEGEGKFSVVDGQQRLRTFFDFMDNNLELKRLGILKTLNGSKYKGLEKSYRNTFKNASIRTIVIKKESDPIIKFEVFERLNTGSVQLNQQELRNCVWRGNYNDLLKELTESADFQYLLGLSEPDNRMRDAEQILRFFSFYHETYLRYKAPMKQFLNKDIEKHRNLKPTEANEMREIFKKSTELSRSVFGNKAFRRFVVGSPKDVNGYWEDNVNKALFDIIMFGFTQYDKPQVIPNSDAIREELIWLMTADKEFIDALVISTNDRSKIYTRFEKWIHSLRNLIGSPTTEPRNFTLKLKESLFNADPTCTICAQRIQSLDDSEVDHIEFYWRGGKTTPENARLTHRYCNRSRGGRD